MDEATKETDEGQKARKGKVILMEKVLQVQRKGSASRSTRIGHLDTWSKVRYILTYFTRTKNLPHAEDG